MTKYRKKPVVIEAFRYGIDALPIWFTNTRFKGEVECYSQFGGEVSWCEIKTLEGTMRGDYGDYIIQGVNGEIYPCKAEIFEKTYERVGDE